MMALMVTALDHYSHQAECFKFHERLCFACRNRELDAVRYVLARGIPAVFPQFTHMGRHHTLDGVGRAAFTCDHNLNSVIEVSLCDCSPQRDLVHINEMLP